MDDWWARFPQSGKAHQDRKQEPRVAPSNVVPSIMSDCFRGVHVALWSARGAVADHGSENRQPAAVNPFETPLPAT
jgi:hypothetical protein